MNLAFVTGDRTRGSSFEAVSYATRLFSHYYLGEYFLKVTSNIHEDVNGVVSELLDGTMQTEEFDASVVACAHLIIPQVTKAAEPEK